MKDLMMLIAASMLIMVTTLHNSVHSEVFMDKSNIPEKINLEAIEDIKNPPVPIDPNPDGKKIRDIYVKTLHPFPYTSSDAFTRFIFHVGNAIVFKSLPGVVRSEIFIQSGDLYDQKAVDENVRYLNGIKAITEVSIYPVQRTEPEQVDLLVITRDLFPYQINADVRWTGGQFFIKTTAIWRNVLGAHKELEIGAFREPYKISSFYVFRDPIFFNSGIRVVQSGEFSWIRDSMQYDGHNLVLVAEKPIITLFDTLGLKIEGYFKDNTTKVFEGEKPKAIAFDSNGTFVPSNHYKDYPDTSLEKIAAVGYRTYRVGFESAVSYAINLHGLHWKTIPGVFYRCIDHQIDFLEELSQYRQFPDTLDQRNENYRKEVFSRPDESELGGSLQLGYFDYFKLQNIYRFNRDEFIRRGMILSLKMGFAHAAIDPFWQSSDRPFVDLTAGISYGFQIAKRILFRGEHTVKSRLSFEGNWYEGDATQRFKIYFRKMVPGTLVLYGVFQAAWNTQPDQPYYVGGGMIPGLDDQLETAGLRAFVANYLSGNRVLRGQVEYRSDPLGFVKWLDIGGALFYEGASIWDSDTTPWENIHFVTSMGLGLRFLLTSINPNMGRLDFAFSPSEIFEHKTFEWEIDFGFSQAF